MAKSLKPHFRLTSEKSFLDQVSDQTSPTPFLTFCITFVVGLHPLQRWYKMSKMRWL